MQIIYASNFAPPRKLVLPAIALGLLCFIPCSRSRAQLPEPNSPAPQAETGRQPYNILRFNESWSFLHDPAKRTDFLDPIKYMPLDPAHLDRYLSVGGEFRGTYEDVLNDNFSNVPYPVNSFGLQRYQLFLDGHIRPQFRFFIQLESGEEQGRPGGPRPIDKKRLDFLNAFIDYRPTKSSRSPLLRIGRQELNFGSGRLVSVREGPNVRQSFYGALVEQKVASWTLNSFAVRPAKDNLGFFDDVPQHTTEFWGVFATRPWTDISQRSLDLYYFGIARKNAVFNRGTADELRHTIGGRIVSPAPKDEDAHPFVPHFDVEGVYQFGSFGRNDIRAWTLSSEFGYILARLPGTPHAGVRSDISSGDEKPTGALGTFNPLFPIGNYFGVISDTGPGPVNFRDVHPDVRLSLPHAVSIDADWLFYWRQSLKDGVYSVPGSLLVPAGASTARFVGHRPGAEVRWQVDAHAYIQADYGIFYAGQFLRAAGRPHNLNYASLWVGYKF